MYRVVLDLSDPERDEILRVGVAMGYHDSLTDVIYRIINEFLARSQKRLAI